MRVLGVIIIMLLSSAAVYANERLLDNTLDMTSIGRIRLMSDINVVCVVDSVAKNIIEFPDTIRDWSNILFLTHERETLTIQISDNNIAERYVGKYQNYTLLIKVNANITEIENGYNSTLKVRGRLSVPELKIIQSGNGSIEIDSVYASKASLSIVTGNGSIIIRKLASDNISCNILGTGSITVKGGVCDNLKCRIIGTGKIDVVRLVAENAKIKYSGGGYVKCNVIRLLSTHGLGTTKISYKGNPHIKRRSNVKPKKISDK